MNNYLTSLCGAVALLALASGQIWAATNVEGNSSEKLRDPTRPLNYITAKETRPEMVLQAILRRDSGREAIINGERVQVGSTVDGARVDSIGEQSVVYSYQGQALTLRLRPQLFKNR